MRILVCTLEPPVPPYNGLRLQLASVVADLATRHEVRVLGFANGHGPGEEGPGGVPMRLVPRPLSGELGRVALVAEAMVTGRPLGVDRLASALRGPLREELATFRPDVLHVTSGEMARLIVGVDAPPAVIGVLDSWTLARSTQEDEARGLRRWLLGHDVHRVRRYEGSQYRRFERVVLVSEEDRRALVSIDPRLDPVVIPNGVDADWYAPDPDARVDPTRIVFHGSLEYGPNVSAADHLASRVLPIVRASVPAAHLVLVGRSPAPRVRALERLPGVRVEGDVPDVRPWLTGSAVYACTMRSGQGIKNKLLEAMACGVPAVATPQSLGGLTVTPGRELLVGDDEGSFARAVVRLLSDPAEAARLGTAGRAYVVAHHTWHSVGLAFERTYREAVAERASSGRASSGRA
jgi:glycosyltransferase involved in cell wall biosynthesis